MLEVHLTSSVTITNERESPNVAQVDGEPDDGQQEVHFLAPYFSVLVVVFLFFGDFDFRICFCDRVRIRMCTTVRHQTKLFFLSWRHFVEFFRGRHAPRWIGSIRKCDKTCRAQNNRAELPVRNLRRWRSNPSSEERCFRKHIGFCNSSSGVIHWTKASSSSRFQQQSSHRLFVERYPPSCFTQPARWFQRWNKKQLCLPDALVSFANLLLYFWFARHQTKVLEIWSPVILRQLKRFKCSGY